jgi:Tfp pilus assembly protein PilX
MNICVHSRQRGATLVVAALFLAVLTLLAVSAVNTSTVNLRIVSNMEAKLDTEAVAQQAIEGLLSTTATFTNPGQTTEADGDFQITRFTPVCLDARPPDTSSLRPVPVGYELTEWELRVQVVDTRTGARTTLREGVGATLLAGNCPE